MKLTSYIAIIPARYASTRFPGKPLALLGGKPVIQHVYEQARRVLDTVIVATDDERIADCVHSFGGRVEMTSSACRCGTERVCEVARHLQLPGDTVVINIQGDEPFIQPEEIEALMALFPTDIATLATPIRTPEALMNPNNVKVVCTPSHEALYFSRSAIPYLRGAEIGDWLARHTYYKHIGLYAYRAEVLEAITQLPPSPLEQAESLEQLRWLEAGYTIRVGLTEAETIGIDTPEDLLEAEKIVHKSYIVHL